MCISTNNYMYLKRKKQEMIFKTDLLSILLFCSCVYLFKYLIQLCLYFLNLPHLLLCGVDTVLQLRIEIISYSY